ncbi:serine/threonine-protein kinase [Verrucomicrobiota bacterium]
MIKLITIMDIAGYSNLEQIGSGKMAIVLKGLQTSLKRAVAIKILRPSFASNQKLINSIVQEIKTAAKLKHPNIAQVYDIAKQEGVFFIVAEYIEGPTLQKILTDKKVLPESKALKIALSVARALREAWETAEVAHRDVKPSNIMIVKNLNVKVTDLGIAKMTDPAILAEQLKAPLVSATLNYMSPEQAKFKTEVDCKCDMYGLGATLYHMVTGRMPFDKCPPKEIMANHEKSQITNPGDINRKLSISTEQIITTLMMKEPEDRYKDWNEVVDQIKKAIAGRKLIGKNLSDLDSTIAPAKQKRVTVATSASPQKTAEALQKIKGSTVPLSVKLPAWLILAVWWTFLTYWQLDRPPSRVPTNRHNKVKTEKTKPKKTKTTRKKKSGTKTAAHTAPKKKTAPQKKETPQKNIAASEKSEPKAVKPKGPQLNAKELSEFKATQKAVASLVLDEGFKQAVFLIDDELEYDHSPAFERELTKTRDFIEEISAINKVILANLKKTKWKKITISHKGSEKKFQVTNVTNREITGTYRTKKEDVTITHTVKVPINEMTAADRLRWLGSADTPAKNAMKCILLFKSGQYSNAKTVAGNCGVFADIFTKLIGSRR